MKKTVSKKRAVHRKAAKRKAPSKAPIIITAVILLLIIAGAVAYFFTQEPAKSSDSIAIVNGNPITDSQLNFQYNLLPPDYKQEFSKEQVLEQIIDEEVIVQAAKRKGTVASQEDIHERVQEIMGRNGLTVEDLQENLGMLNFTTEEFERLIARQITIERYLNETINLPEVTDEQVMAAYEAGKENYRMESQVTVRHVLISNQRDDSALAAKEIYDRAKAGADFCELVLNASDDRGSKETCGEYTFAAGYMVPEFEKASFDMRDGEYRLIQTQFGHHIIKKLNSTPAGLQSLDQVRDTLREDISAKDRAEQYRSLVARLRGAATIAYANGTTLLPRQQQAVIAPAEPVEEQPVPVAKKQDPEQDLYSCIARSATLYGSSWNTDSQEAKELFDAKGVNIRYVECTDNKECSWTKGYPTWVIKDREYIGKLSLEQLKDASGC